MGDSASMLLRGNHGLQILVVLQLFSRQCHMVKEVCLIQVRRLVGNGCHATLAGKPETDAKILQPCNCNTHFLNLPNFGFLLCGKMLEINQFLD
jgi:hypothetical protein